MMKCRSCREFLAPNMDPPVCVFHKRDDEKQPPWIHPTGGCLAKIEGQGDPACCTKCCKEKRWLLCTGCKLYVPFKEGKQSRKCSLWTGEFWHSSCLYNFHGKDGVEEHICKACLVPDNHVRCSSKGCEKYGLKLEFKTCSTCKMYHVHEDCLDHAPQNNLNF